MEQFEYTLETFIEGFGWLAPLLFVLLHLLRPLLFLPVILVCVIGGLVFGFWEGALLSFIGLSLMSLVSYLLVNKFPKFRKKISDLKNRMFSDRKISVGQVMILRIMPFVHFHLLSLYLMEMTKTRKEYMYYSMLGLIAPAIIYTAFGEAITEFPWYVSLTLFLVLALVYVVIGKMNKVRLNVGLTNPKKRT
ncbi:TVP38/TMEM64 family protein [Planococcus sp. 1R117A]|uniref:TVP38/TMEM64 family protein n=1 Tax=Planococcus sp. 1R117A TaxID=3447020 RepID=UPI003EDC43B8